MRIISALAIGLALATPAPAHVQSIYAETLTPTERGDIPLQLIFWHPFMEGPAIDMPRPLEAFALHRGERIDLMESLTEFTFASPENEVAAWRAALPVTGAGDYVTAVVTDLYFDETAGGYIQQFAKTVLNRGGVPTDWNAPLGLPTEIVPMVKPYNVIAGSTFTGLLLRDGEPLSNYGVEVLYLSPEPDLETGGVQEETVSPPPGGMIVATTDPNGVFTFGIPLEGFWGFTALSSGPAYRAEDGHYLSQDAVLWIEAVTLR